MNVLLGLVLGDILCNVKWTTPWQLYFDARNLRLFSSKSIAALPPYWVGDIQPILVKIKLILECKKPIAKYNPECSPNPV